MQVNLMRENSHLMDHLRQAFPASPPLWLFTRNHLDTSDKTALRFGVKTKPKDCRSESCFHGRLLGGFDLVRYQLLAHYTASHSVFIYAYTHQLSLSLSSSESGDLPTDLLKVLDPINRERKQHSSPKRGWQCFDQITKMQTKCLCEIIELIRLILGFGLN